MNTRQLLIHAARAGGITGKYESWSYCGINEGIKLYQGSRHWNSLRNEEDAFRLAADLGMNVFFWRGAKKVRVQWFDDSGEAIDLIEDINGRTYHAAACYAITWVAAEISATRFAAAAPAAGGEQS